MVSCHKAISVTTVIKTGVNIRFVITVRSKKPTNRTLTPKPKQNIFYEKLMRFLCLTQYHTVPMEKTIQTDRRKKSDKAKEKYEKNGKYSKKSIRTMEELRTKHSQSKDVKSK